MNLLEKELQKELECLEIALGLPNELKLKILPMENRNDGEIKGNTVYIYNSNLENAKAILRHELLDYAITKYEAPWRDLALTLIENFTRSQYKRKEELIERIIKIPPYGDLERRVVENRSSHVKIKK